jgi:hypothetical protein
MSLPRPPLGSGGARHDVPQIVPWVALTRSRSAGPGCRASALAIGLAVPANASTCTPLAGLAKCLPAYQVTGTPDNSLVEWSGEPGSGAWIVGSVPNGTTLYVVCQANDGPQQDGEYNAPGVPSQTYDLSMTLHSASLQAAGVRGFTTSG